MEFNEEKTSPSRTAANRPRLALFTSFSGQGGVENMVVNLCNGIVARGQDLELLLVREDSPSSRRLDPRVKVVRMGSGHTLSSVPALTRYLKTRAPSVLLAAKHRACQVAVLARRLAAVKPRLTFRIGTTVSAALAGKTFVRKWPWYGSIRLFYPAADGIIAVSQGVADDLQQISGLPAERFHVVPNPVITPDLVTRAREEVDHRWVQQGRRPLLLAIGRLTRQKDFPTLLRAVARVHQTRPCYLIILGDGQDRDELMTLADELGIGAFVDLPGYQTNPYSYLSRASLFVLSSAWEGSPNVLVESMALGTPVVSTDCPSGPREILQEGRLGPLVPVGDPERLAQAILQVLEAPVTGAQLQKAVEPYTVMNSCSRYLQVMLGAAAGSSL